MKQVEAAVLDRLEAHAEHSAERIAQVVLARYSVLPWVEGTVHVTTSRTGGVGST